MKSEVFNLIKPIDSTVNENPLKENDIKIDTYKRPNGNKLQQIKDHLYDYGVKTKTILPEEPGEFIFNDDKPQRIWFFSNHETVIGNSVWQTVHRFLHTAFKDPKFNLENRKSCLYQNNE